MANLGLEDVIFDRLKKSAAIKYVKCCKEMFGNTVY